MSLNCLPLLFFFLNYGNTFNKLINSTIWADQETMTCRTCAEYSFIKCWWKRLWLEILPTLSDEYADELFDILDQERKKFYNEYIIKKNGENNWTVNVL